MPWMETNVMDQRTEFVLRALRGVERFGDLCRDFGITRKTGYKWIRRYFLTLQSSDIPHSGRSESRDITDPTWMGWRKTDASSE